MPSKHFPSSSSAQRIHPTLDSSVPAATSRSMPTATIPQFFECEHLTLPHTKCASTVSVGMFECLSEFPSYWCVLRREWMGCWGLLGLLLIVMDHSRKFPTFSTSKPFIECTDRSGQGANFVARLGCGIWSPAFLRAPAPEPWKLLESRNHSETLGPWGGLCNFPVN